MAEVLYTCEICGTSFNLAKRIQIHRDGERVRYFCSEPCRKSALTNAPTCQCEKCGRSFALEFAYQELAHEGGIRKVCSMECRQALMADLSPRRLPTVRFCVANQKGGTGKTTTAFHLAVGFAGRGVPTLLIDADPQGSLTDMFESAGAPGLAEVLQGKASLMESARRLRDNLHFLPTGRDLVTLGLDRSLDANLLKKRLSPMDDFRVVILDPSPASSPLTEAALAFSGGVLVPVSCDYLAIHGVRQLSQTLAGLRERLGRVVTLIGVVPTFFDGRTRATRAVMEVLERHFPGKVLPPIRASADVRETGASNRPVFEASPSGRGAADYRVLLDAVAARIGMDG
jgi:chromosome partitioning protein